MRTPIMSSHSRVGSRNSAGMTLVEIIISIGIFGVIALMGLYALASSVNRNRSTEMAVANTLAVRQVIEELISLSESTVSSQSVSEDARGGYSRPLELIRYLLSNQVPPEYEVTRQGGGYLTSIVCRFPGVIPGFAMRDDQGNRINNTPMGDGNLNEARSIVTMILYLDEGAVPRDLANPLPQGVYDDLSTSGSSPTRVGIDINGDGQITNGGFLSNSNKPIFSHPGIGPGYRRITHLPIDIVVEHAAQGAAQQGQVIQRAAQRIIITDFSNLD